MAHPSAPLLALVPVLAAISLPAAIALSTTQVAISDRTLLSGSYQRAYEDAFAENMPLTDFAHTAYTAATLALFNQAGPEVVIAETDWLFTAEEFRQPGNIWPLRETLSDARDQLAEAGITLLPVIVPDKARVYADHLPRPRDPEIEARYQDALRLLGAMGFAMVDLSRALTQARAENATFMRTDTHWSAFGAQVAADSLAQAAGLVGGGIAQFHTTLEAETAFEGDLLRFVDAGAFATWVGPAPERFARPVTSGASEGLGLFDTVEIDIVLVGTSFSARPEFNFAGYLQQATGLNLVNLAVEGQGPFGPMRSALESGAITDLSPNFVIWEIPERYIHARSLP